MQNITETGLSTISNKIAETVLSNRVKKKSAVYLFSSTLDPYIITSWFAIVLDEIKN